MSAARALGAAVKACCTGAKSYAKLGGGRWKAKGRRGALGDGPDRGRDAAHRTVLSETIPTNRMGRIPTHAPMPESRSSAATRLPVARGTNCAVPGLAERFKLWLRFRSESAARTPVFAPGRAASARPTDTSAMAAIVTQTHALLLRFCTMCLILYFATDGFVARPKAGLPMHGAYEFRSASETAGLTRYRLAWRKITGKQQPKLP